MTPVILTTARADIIRQFRWYLVEKDVPDAAFRFLDAVDESMERLLQMPHSGAPTRVKNPALEGLRSWPVTGFGEIRIFYLVRGDTLRVIRILHGKRDVAKILEKESATTPCSSI